MILKSAPSKYESNIQSTGKHLTILATSKAMDILSKGIYSRPVEACVREICSNAYDAHVQAGIGHRPFEVTLPTYSDSTFKVRDFGNSIPADEIRNIFATYFSSSKTEDNTQVGCLGLGSKSPLAVSNQFSVESWKDGYYYLWTIYKDENNFPTMSDEPIIKRETTDPSGIRVSIPVDYSKRQDFANAVVKVLPYFKTLPTITNGPQLVKKTKRVEFENCWFEDGSGSYALMGNVLYPINPEIKGLEEYKDLSSQGKLIIPFELGKLEFDASRENLSYSQQIIALLKIKFKEVVSEFSKTIHSKIASAKNAYQAVVSFNEVTNHFDSKLANAIYADMQYEGKPLNTLFPNRKSTNWYKQEPLVPGQKAGELYTLSPYRRSKFGSVLTVEPKSSVHFIYNDDKSKNLIARLWLYNESLNGKVNPVYINENVDLDKWLEANHLTKEDLVPMSSIPKVPSRGKSGESRRRAGIFGINGGMTKSYFWKKLDKCPESGYYFVKSDDDVLLGEAKKNICDIHYNLKSLGVLPADLFGITKTSLKNFQGDPKFKLAEDYIKEKLEATVENVMKAKAHSSDGHLSTLAKFWPENGKMLSDMSFIEKWKGDVDKYITAYRYFGIKHPEYTGPKLDSKTIFAKFPMLEYVVNVYYKVNPSAVKTYIMEWAKLKGIEY